MNYRVRQNTRNGLTALVIAMVMILPEPAWGVVATGTPPTDFSGRVIGYCDSTTPYATATQVAEDAQWSVQSINYSFNDDMQQATQSLEQDQDKNTTAITKAMNGQTRLLYNQMKQQFAVQRAAKQADEFNPAAGYNRPIGGCASPEVGTEVMQGDQIRQSILNAEYVDDAKYANNTATGKANTQRLASLPAAALTARTLFPQTHTFATPSDAQSAREYAQTVIDPNPPVVLSKTEKATAAGERYQALSNERNAKVALAQQIMDRLIASRMPSIPADGWAAQAWASMGNSGKPPGEVNGKMSEEAMLSLLVNSRFGNSAWYSHVLAGESKIGVLREMALMQAISLRIQLEQLKLQQDAAAILAARYAKSVEKTEDPRLVRAAQMAEKQ